MLSEGLLKIETSLNEHFATLPEALARLCDGTLIGFDGLAAHQRHAWALFLYQLAALALVGSGEAGAATDDSAWRALDDADGWAARLAALTPGCDDTAWSLVVDDPSRPALLQPPILSGSLGVYSELGRTPDEIDVLVTAKGHDVKPSRATDAQPRHWLFALVALQTQQGYSGRGNFGIARMNGGFASRPLMMIAPSRSWPDRFRRGVQAALSARHRALDLQGGYYRRGGLKLLWLESWDEDRGLPLADLDPLFIEVCRRVRLVRMADGQLAALGRASAAARVRAPEEAKGNLGDAWTPIEDGAALTVGRSGFDYRKLCHLLTSRDVQRPVAMDDPPGHLGDAWLQAAVLVRGQGKTEGLHERWLRVPETSRGKMGRAVLGDIGRAMLRDASEARQILGHGLAAFLQGGGKADPLGGGDKVDFKDERPRAWLDQLDQAIDAMFFDHLFAILDDEETAEAVWHASLGDLVRKLFSRAIKRLSAPQGRLERAHARASSIVGARLAKAGLVRVRSADLEDAAWENAAWENAA